MILRDNNELNISWLCQNAGVSRTGYYNWLNSAYKRSENDAQDKADFDLILQAYQLRGYNKGRREIYICLLKMGIRMNQKKISRLMKKFDL